MFGDRRSHQRFQINRVARIYADQAGLTCECTISDISEGGARLFVSDITLPDRFLLQIVSDKPTREECKVVWRLGGELGVQFVTKSMEQSRSEAINQLRALSQHKFKKAI
jgi:PilZ domain